MNANRLPVSVSRKVVCCATLMVVVLSFACCPKISHAANAQETNNMNTTQATLATADAAKSRAVGLTGFQATIKSVEEVVLSDSNIPFLAGKVIGRPVWLVKFSPFMLGLKSTKGGTDGYQRDFEVVLDKETGQLVSLKSTFSGTLPAGQTLLPPPTHLEAESQLTSQHGPFYTGFPTTDPKFSFIQALDAIEKDGIDHPYQSIELAAIYVTVPLPGPLPVGAATIIENGGHVEIPMQPTAVWVIGLRGLSGSINFGRRLPGAPSDQALPASKNDGLAYLTIMVDSATGKVLSSGSSVPRPTSLGK
jgi:hypothetical protein